MNRLNNLLAGLLTILSFGVSANEGLDKAEKLFGAIYAAECAAVFHIMTGSPLDKNKELTDRALNVTKFFVMTTVDLLTQAEQREMNKEEAEKRNVYYVQKMGQEYDNSKESIYKRISVCDRWVKHVLSIVNRDREPGDKAFGFANSKDAALPNSDQPYQMIKVMNDLFDDGFNAWDMMYRRVPSYELKMYKAMNKTLAIEID